MQRWESFFSSLKTERTARRMYRTRDDAGADVFDYIECFYNPKRRHSTGLSLSRVASRCRPRLLSLGEARFVPYPSGEGRLAE